MRDPFLEEQWRDLNKRLQQCADHIAGSDQSLAAEFAQQAANFAESDLPTRYPIFLDRVREAAGMAVKWQKQRDEQTSLAKVSGAESEFINGST